MKKFQKFTTCLTAALLLSPLAVVDAKTYIVNNANSDKLGKSEVLGAVPSADIAKQKNIFGDLKHSGELHQIDKNFDVKVSKDKITQSKSQIPNLAEDYNVGDTRNFTTVNMVTNADEQTKATLQYNGTKAQVWVGDNRVTKEKAEQIGKEFDSKIGPSVEKYFSTPSDIDQNGKINILVFDIKDDFEKTGSYVGGYFHPRDLLMMQGSNMSETFYMDTFPSMGKDGEMDVTKIYTTLAHEYQHMVNFNRNIFVEKGDFIDGKMDTWLNEAFSMASEQIYSGEPLTRRIDYYNKSESIANGHSLIQWQNNGDVLSNYSLSYLFGQYLRTQASNGDEVFKAILEDSGTTVETLQNAIHKYVDPNMSVEQFMTNFRVALEKKDADGPFGFKGEAGFEAIKPVHISNLPESLAPQGSVVFDAADDFKVPTDKGEHIKYVEVDNPSTTPETPSEPDSPEEPTNPTDPGDGPEPCPNGDYWCPGNYPQ